MVILKDKSKRKFIYKCDMCGKVVSYKQDTLFQLHVKTKENKTKKVCELCDSCYKKICRAIARERKKSMEADIND